MSDDRLQYDDLQGNWALKAEAMLDGTRGKERIEAARTYGLESADSVQDRTIPLFERGRRLRTQTFLGVPFIEDMRKLDGHDVAIIGAPYDGGTTNRPGTRFGPEEMRRVTNEVLWSYNPVEGATLTDVLDIVDTGDISIIGANIEKSFDQIAKAIAYVAEREIFPVVLGGDHSIGYPDVRGLSPYVNGNIGIIHFDRHSDLSEQFLDERMHGSPFFHATNIPNAPPQNLVQIGIGDWAAGTRDGIAVARDRNATVITMADVEHYGVDKIIEIALEIAWHNADAVWISFDVDSVDPAFAPGTGTPVTGGLLPREVLRMIRSIAREGLIGMEVVEVAPPYDTADITSILGATAAVDCIGELMRAGKFRNKPPAMPDVPYELPGLSERS